jgi:gas vesicle protein
MAYEYDRLEREDGGGSFLMGLLAGTVLGAGLGMLFAPKAGAELRNQLNEQAGKLRSTANDTLSQVKATANDTLSQVKSTANDTYSQASDKVSQIVDKGKEAYDRARTSNVSNINSAAPATGTTGTTGSSGFQSQNPNRT